MTAVSVLQLAGRLPLKALLGNLMEVKFTTHLRASGSDPERPWEDRSKAVTCPEVQVTPSHPEHGSAPVQVERAFPVSMICVRT